MKNILLALFLIVSLTLFGQNKSVVNGGNTIDIYDNSIIFKSIDKDGLTLRKYGNDINMLQGGKTVYTIRYAEVKTPSFSTSDSLFDAITLMLASAGTIWVDSIKFTGDSTFIYRSYVDSADYALNADTSNYSLFADTAIDAINADTAYNSRSLGWVGKPRVRIESDTLLINSGVIRTDSIDWYSSLTDTIYGYFNGQMRLVPKPAGSGSVGNADSLNGQPASYYLARANHTGTQASSTIIVNKHSIPYGGLAGTLTSDTTALMRKGTGEVGITQSAPIMPLHISGVTSNKTGVALTNTTTGHTATDGTRLEINQNGRANISNLENQGIRFLTNATERMRIDSTGKIGLGKQTTPTELLDFADNTAGNSRFKIAHYTDNSLTNSAGITFARSRSNTIGTAVRTLNNDRLGIISFQATNSIPIVTDAAYIIVKQSGTNGSTVPSVFEFYQAPSTSVSPILTYNFFYTGKLGVSNGSNAAPSTPTYNYSINGNAAGSVGLERHTTAANAGNNLSVVAGGAVSGGTNLNGGSVVITSGTATGNGGSTVLIQTVATGQGSGTTDRTATTTATFAGDGSLTTTGYLIGKQVVAVLMDSTDQTTSLVTGGYRTLKSFRQKIALNCTTTDSSITVPVAGYYDISFNNSFSFSVNSKIIHCSIFRNDVETFIEMERKIGTGGDVGNSSMRGYIYLPANCVVKVKGITDGNGDMTRTHSSFTLNLITN